MGRCTDLRTTPKNPLQSVMFSVVTINYLVTYTSNNIVNFRWQQVTKKHLHSRALGRGSSVGKATRYGLDGPGIESRWGRDWSWGLPSLLYNGYRVFRGGKAAGAWRRPPTPSKRRGHERVELYKYSPFGSQGPVIGRIPLYPSRALAMNEC